MLAHATSLSGSGLGGGGLALIFIPGLGEHFLVMGKQILLPSAHAILCTYCSMCAPYNLFSRLLCPNARC